MLIFYIRQKNVNKCQQALGLLNLPTFLKPDPAGARGKNYLPSNPIK